MNEKRLIFLLIVFFSFFVILFIRLWNIQIKMHENYHNYALAITESTETQMPFRGEIYDRNGNLLASTKKIFRMYVDKSMLRNLSKVEKDTLIKILYTVTGNNANTYNSRLKGGGKDESGIVYLENDLSYDKYLKLIELKARKSYRNLLACIGFEKYSKRLYTNNVLAAHVLGYVDKNSRGLDGVEKYYDKILQGTPGKIVYRKDARGLRQGIIVEKSTEAVDGYDLELTIDREIQKILEDEIKIVYEETKANSTLGLVIDPNTGEILALANYPTFNPQEYYKYSDEVRKNKAISIIYDPGSTFKTFTLATAFELNKIKLDTLVSAERGLFKVTNHMSISDDHFKFEMLTPAEALIYSSNIVFAKIGKMIGVENMNNSLMKFGFGNLTGIDLPGEVRGKFVLSNKSDDLNVYWISHGYSISITPLQLVMMYAAVINGGMLLKPFVVKRIFNDKDVVVEEFKPKEIRQVISKNTSVIVKALLEKVVLEGTGRKAKLENVSCGGKTGTALKYFENVGYTKGKYISSFIGFFPVDNPKYLILIKIDSPKSGYYAGEIAAPVFKRVGDKIWQRDHQMIEINKKMYTHKHDSGRKVFPDLTGNFVDKAIETAKSFDVKVELTGKGDIVIGQIYDSKHKKVIFLLDNSSENLHKEGNNRIVPSLVGLPKKIAVTKLKSLQVPFVVEGTGYVVYQSIKPGTVIESDSLIRIRCN